MKIRFFLFMIVCLIFNQTISSQEKIHREDTEWANFWMVNVNDHDLPHILMIGNSITQRYSPLVAEALKGKAYCSRLTTSKSLGDPFYLKEVEMALAHNNYQVIHFNNGLHGRDYTEDEFIRDFSKLYKLIKKYAPKAQLVWATITPVRDKQKLDILDDFNNRVIERNKRVLAYLKGKDVMINDLYSILIDRPDLYSVGDGIHPNDKGNKLLSEQVINQISKLLEHN